jgi:hypothetical protein
VFRIGSLGIAVLILGACEEPKKKPLPEAPKVIEGLSIGDKPVKTETRLAIGTEGESAWRITVASEKVTCKQLVDAYPERPEGLKGTRVDFWVNQPIEPDGSRGPWTFRSAYIGDADGERGLRATGAGLEGLEAGLETITVKGLELACQDRKDMVMWNGSLKAKNCGRVAREEEDRPQEELTLSIAGEPMPIHGASVRPQGDNFHLRLTRAPHKCSSAFTEGYDFYLDVAFKGGTKEDEPLKLQFASLMGDVFPGDPAGSKGKETFELSAEDVVTGTGDVEITLKGEIDVGGYPVKLDGKVSARRCTPVAAIQGSPSSPKP